MNYFDARPFVVADPVTSTSFENWGRRNGTPTLRIATAPDLPPAGHPSSQRALEPVNTC